MLIFKNAISKSKSLNKTSGKNIGRIQSYCKVDTTLPYLEIIIKKKKQLIVREYYILKIYP